jgi:NitT/TauT family transport system permease protein
MSLDQQSVSLEGRELKRPRVIGRPHAATSLQLLKRVARNAGPPILVLAAFIGAWNYVSYETLDPERRFLLPPPIAVWHVGFANGANLSEVLKGLWSTAQVALIGLAIAMALGVAIAVLMSQAKWIERSLYPYAVVLQTIPVLALVPLIGFWFGFDMPSRVLVVIIFSLFPIITNTLFGLQSVDAEHHDLFTLHQARRISRLWRLQLPAAIPAMLTGFRISAGLAVIGAIVGDFFFRQGEPGIGRLLDIYSQRLQTEQLITAILLSSLLGLVVFWFFGFLGHRLTRSWHESARRQI